MSRVAILEGLGRHRRRKLGAHRKHRKHLGVSPKAKPGTHWHMNKNRGRGKGPKTPAQRAFAKAAHSCKFPTKGTPVARRRSYNNCIKFELLKAKK